MRLPGFGGSAPATPQESPKIPGPEVAAAAAEKIASRNQGSSRRPEFFKKQRAALLTEGPKLG